MPRAPGTTWQGWRNKLRKQKAAPVNLHPFAPGHGQRIWVFKHYVTKQVIYSHTHRIHATRMMRQLPFNGKKSKPAKLRKDYWKQMALIQFPDGKGMIGQNVMQKLRELRHLHEVSWGGQRKLITSTAYQKRGKILNDQVANTVADIAAVLSGAGKGNKVNLPVVAEGNEVAVEAGKEAAEVDGDTAEPGKEPSSKPSLLGKVASVLTGGKKSTASQSTNTKGASGQEPKKGTLASYSEEEIADALRSPKPRPSFPAPNWREEPVPLGPLAPVSLLPRALSANLQPATIYWAEETDRLWARQWPRTVQHFLGLPVDHHDGRGSHKTVEQQKIIQQVQQRGKARRELEARRKEDEEARTVAQKAKLEAKRQGLKAEKEKLKAEKAQRNLEHRTRYEANQARKREEQARKAGKSAGHGSFRVPNLMLRPALTVQPQDNARL